MAPQDILARLTDHDGDTLFDALGDWPRWLPSVLAWLIVGLAAVALLVTVSAPAPV